MLENRFIRQIQIDWGKIEACSYLRDIPALSGIRELSFPKNVTFFVGENGTGKSTLLEAIAAGYGFNREGGSLNYRFSTFDDVSELCSALSFTKGFRRPASSYFFRAESFFNVATKAEDYRLPGEKKENYYARYGGKSLHEQSHGESFLSYFLAFEGPGLYIMDEPEAALSPQRQLTLLIQLVKMAAQGSQFLIASHSPILLGTPDAQILSFDDGHIHPCSYEETESYQVTELFLNHREALLNRLLDES